MPLSINVGLSRKASKDFQSTGCSINVTAELDQTLLAKPDELQRQINDLYCQAEEAIERQVGAPIGTSQDRPARETANYGRGERINSNGRYARNGGRRGAGERNGGGEMTESQRRAIHAIGKRANIDVEAEARDIVGAGLDDLTLRQASDLIDHLRSLQPSGGR